MQCSLICGSRQEGVHMGTPDDNFFICVIFYTMDLDPFEQIFTLCTPGELSNPVVVYRPSKRPDDSVVHSVATQIAETCDDPRRLYLYLEDALHPKIPEQQVAEIELVLKGLRREIFQAVPSNSSAILTEQSQKSFRQNRPLWRGISAVQGPIRDLLPDGPVESLRLKLKMWSRTKDIHQFGRGALASPFLAEELVVRDGEQSVSVAPDRSGWTTLSDALPRLNSEQASRAVWTSMQGAAVLHSKYLVHNDIKPENIFWDGTKGVLFDFELASPEDADRTTVGYEEGFFSANISLGQDIRSRDIFSFGMTLGTVHMRNLLWSRDFACRRHRSDPHTHQVALRQELSAGGVTSPMLDLILDMTNLVGDERPDINDCITRLGMIYDFGDAQV